MVVRAKFRLDAQTNRDYNNGAAVLSDFEFNAVTKDDCPENKAFWKWTPCGQIKLGSVNPEVLKEFTLGREFYIDFIPVEKSTQISPS